MIKFEVISDYKDKNINIPKRGTKASAGYDIEAAEDMTIPSIFQSIRDYVSNYDYTDPSNTVSIHYFQDAEFKNMLTMDEVKKLVKQLKLRTMIPTGLKVKMDENVVLQLHPRSSTGSNCLLQLANQTGIIDADYYNNEDNEGHIFVPLINLSPVDIKIKKGDKIAQGIFVNYLTTDDDEASNERTGGFGSTDLTKVETSSIPSSISNNDYKYDNLSKIIDTPVKQVSISYIKEPTTTTGSIPKYNKSKSHNKKK